MSADCMLQPMSLFLEPVSIIGLIAPEVLDYDGQYHCLHYILAPLMLTIRSTRSDYVASLLPYLRIQTVNPIGGQSSF